MSSVLPDEVEAGLLGGENVVVLGVNLLGGSAVVLFGGSGDFLSVLRLIGLGFEKGRLIDLTHVGAELFHLC